jgi:hemolysin activation/secretion protein
MKIKAAFASLLTLLPLPSFGQGAADSTLPSPPPEPRNRERIVESDSSTRGAVKAADDQELLPALVGIAIAPSADAALALQSRMQHGIRIEGFSDAETAALREAAGAFLDKPVSLKSLDRMTSRLEAALRSQGRMFMRISFPDQEITSGLVALRISPAIAGQVLMAGKPGFGAKFAANAFRTRPGDLISGDVVLDDLDWLNENPLRRASIAYGDGATNDTLDLTMRLTADKPWRVYGGIDNQLSENLGDERLFIGYQHGDLFSLDHRFTGQYTSALEFDRLQGVSGSYEIPLPSRHLLDILAGYTESESDVLGPLDQSGEFSRLGLSYRMPLPRFRSTGHEWRMGMEFRNNDYLFPNGSNATVKFFQIETGWNAKRIDRFGTTRLDASLLYSPGQGILGSEDEDFIALGASGAESLILRLDAERTWKLGDAGMLLGRFRGQVADSDLLSSDQIYTGGANRVRGFDETVGYASNGMFASIEMRSRSFHAGRAGDWLAVAFVDGAVLDRDYPSFPGELLSTGMGLRWRLSDHLSAKADLGIPLTYPNDEDGAPLFHFAVSKTW